MITGGGVVAQLEAAVRYQTFIYLVYDLPVNSVHTMWGVCILTILFPSALLVVCKSMEGLAQLLQIGSLYGANDTRKSKISWNAIN